MKRLLCLVVAQFAVTASGAAMEFRVAGNQLIMSGPIAGNEIAKMRDILPGNPQIDTVVLQNSEGGFIETAMRLGELFEEKKFRTIVSGYCMSACVLLFLGGRERSFAGSEPGKVSLLSIHTPMHSSFGGQSWPPAGSTFRGAQYQMLNWMQKRIGDRVDKKILESAIQNDRPEDMTMFVNPAQVTRADKISVFRCTVGAGMKASDCVPIPGIDAIQAGLITSTSIATVNP